MTKLKQLPSQQDKNKKFGETREEKMTQSREDKESIDKEIHLKGVLRKFTTSPFDLTEVIHELEKQILFDPRLEILAPDFYEAQANFLLWNLAQKGGHERIDFIYSAHDDWVKARNYATLLSSVYQRYAVAQRIRLLEWRTIIHQNSLEFEHKISRVRSRDNWDSLEWFAITLVETAICLANRNQGENDLPLARQLWDEGYPILCQQVDQSCITSARLASFMFRWANSGATPYHQQLYAKARRYFRYFAIFTRENDTHCEWRSECERAAAYSFLGALFARGDKELKSQELETFPCTTQQIIRALFNNKQ